MQKRLVAIATALVLLGVGVLAQQHAAEAAHVHEHSGRVVHAQALADHHEADSNAHIHGRAAHAHEGVCSLLAIAHGPLVVVASTTLVSAALTTTTLAGRASSPARFTRAAYRIAPKTSPPRA
jgi:hypothetical protein